MTRSSRVGRATAIPLLLLTGCAGGASDTGETAAAGELPDAVIDALAAGEPVELLVRVDDADIDEAIAELRGPEDASGDRWELREDRAERWAERAAAFAAGVPRTVEVRPYAHFPVLVVRLSDYADAERIAGRGDVLSIEPNVRHTLSLSQSLDLIDQPEAYAAGFGGAGTSVAVLDTGADYTVSDLGACTAVGTPSTCRVAYAADFAPDDRSQDDNGHGTNVSAIVARVAPDADILALDVFTGTGAWSTDILEALDWVVSYKDTYDIASVNMSLGSGAYGSTCVNAFTLGVASVRAAGVSVVVASGNDAQTSAVASPACVDGAFAVGAVYDTNLGSLTWSSCSDAATAPDKVACFSNSSSLVDALAPGVYVNAGGRTMSGTSMAAPHVAGAMAVLRAADPSASVATLEARVKTNGDTVTDARNGLSFPRLDLASSVGDCVSGLSATSGTAAATGDSGSISVTAIEGCGWTASTGASWITLDRTSGTSSGTVGWTAAANTGAARTGTFTVAGRTITVSQAADAAPSGAVTIAGGAAGTRTSAVTLTLSASDATGGVATMCLSNSTSCTAWRSYETSLAWTLSSGVGTKTVYATFRDAYGNTSTVASDTIALDTTAPSNGTVSASGATGAATLSWSGYADSASGVASYVVMQAASATAPSSCTSGTPAWTGTATTATLSGLTNGTTYSFRVCAVDGAGNTSTGATASVVPAAEYVAPTGSIVLASDAAWSSARTVTVALSASDASGVASACVSNSTSCSAWFTMKSSLSWSLSSGSGTKTVYAWFKDIYGNVSAVASDTIGYDATAPTNGTVTATGSTGAAELAWTGFSDAGSGIASYKVVYGTSSPGSCSTGTTAYAGTATSTSLSGLTDGTTYYVRVCAIDALGLTSTGATASVRPAAEYTAPTGSITVNGGASWTNARKVTITSSASDANGVTYMCFSNSSTCSSWQAYATSATFSLSSSSGTRTVSAWFRDPSGNVSEVTTDTIGYDATKPTGGALTATMGVGEAALSWSGFSDSASGVASYKVVYAAGSAPSSCSAGTVGYEGTATSATLTGLTAGTSYGFRACAVDTATNVSSGVTASGTAG